MINTINFRSIWIMRKYEFYFSHTVAFFIWQNMLETEIVFYHEKNSCIIIFLLKMKKNEKRIKIWGIYGKDAIIHNLWI